MAARKEIDGETDLVAGIPEEAARATSPARSCASNSTGRLDPSALVNKRSHHRRNFTRYLNLARKAIAETGVSSYTADLIKKADAHYEQSMYYHHRHCAKLGITDEVWLENLRHDFLAAHEEFKVLRHAEQPAGPSSPATRTRSRVHVHRDLADPTHPPGFTPLDVPPGSLLQPGEETVVKKRPAFSSSNRG
ncbi:hypothetical protein GHT06_018625 [Daphnia sinensis]|uniref:Uncharacterized protein n=1 Tax=Daphnia sinensis TaxID=1820382 RepID=A0AAD5L5F5_9CRUS|nr:hypothetical protein GHT06_018625 [Daphnia sinensis]